MHDSITSNIWNTTYAIKSIFVPYMIDLFLIVFVCLCSLCLSVYYLSVSLLLSFHSVLENYFKWQLIEPYIKFLGAEFLDIYYTYTSIGLGSGEVDRYLTCISYLETFVPFSLSRLYTMYVLPNGTKGNVSEMVEEVKNAFKQRLSENKWLDDKTRERSIWKVIPSSWCILVYYIHSSCYGYTTFMLIYDIFWSMGRQIGSKMVCVCHWEYILSQLTKS